jgi:hypothetical protein
MKNDFIPTFWNTLTQYNGKSRTSRVSAGQVAYKKRGYAWGGIVTDIESDFTATKFPGNIQFPRNAQDWLDAEFNGEYSAKRQVTEGNWNNSEDAFVIRMRADCPTNSTGIIHPDKPWQVIYYNAFGQGQNLIYSHWHGKVSRLEHVIEITEMPAGDSEYLTYDFYIQSNDATTFVGENFDQRPWAGNSGDGATVHGFDVFLAKGNDPATIRGAILRKPVCWWTNLDGTYTQKNVRVDFVIQDDGITVKATKYVLRADIAEALAQGSVYRADVTFSPDPHPEASSVDGRVRCDTGNQFWSAMIAASGTGSDDANVLTYFGLTPSSLSPRYSEFWYPVFLFDTSSIGAGQQVDSATLDLHTANSFPSNDDLGISSNIYGQVVASNTALAASDYDGNSPTTPFTDTPRDVKSESVTAQYVTHTFNAAGKAAVNTEGVSSFCWNLVQARENSTAGDPTWSGSGYRENRLAFRASEYTGTASDPFLTVTHSSPGPAIPVIIHHLKQQGIT